MVIDMRKMNVSILMSFCLIVAGSFIVANDLFSASKSSKITKMKSVIKKQQYEINLLSLKLKQCSGGGYFEPYSDKNKIINTKKTAYVPVYIPNQPNISSDEISYP
jgi:hypothetical protein